MTCNLPVTYNETKYANLISYAQIGCNNYIRSLNLEDKKALHIGIGTSSILKYLRFIGVPCVIDGVTIIKEEMEVNLDYLDYGYNKLWLINKYDPELFAKISSYDMINDVNLKSSACCEDHWKNYFEKLLTVLKPGGILVTHTQGYPFLVPSKLKELTTAELKSMLPEEYSLTEVTDLTNEYGHYPVVIKRGGV